MHLINKNTHGATVVFSQEELRIFCNAIPETIHQLDSEFQTRTGWEIEEALDLLKRLQQVQEKIMATVKQDT